MVLPPAVALPFVDFCDEFVAGLSPAGAGVLRDSLHASVTELTLAMLTLPQVACWIAEVPLVLWASRKPRARVIAAALGVMALAAVGAACSTNLVLLAMSTATLALASTVGCAIAQAALMDAAPQDRERGMARWVFGGTLGDLLGPALLGVFGATLFGWRATWLAAAVVLSLAAFALSRVELPAAAFHDDDTRGVSADVQRVGALRAALENPKLLLWEFGSTLCNLLDETFVALATLWTVAHFRSEPRAVAIVLAACTLGALAGLFVMQRALNRISPRALLVASCVGSCASFFAWLGSDSLFAATITMFVLGGCIAFHYPLAQAQAYRAAGSRSDAVAAFGAILGAFDFAYPIALGLIADRFGLEYALIALLLQPLGILGVLTLTRPPAR
jgi:MFS transporter, FSR family, fosmidomycin resistance protein